MALLFVVASLSLSLTHLPQELDFARPDGRGLLEKDQGLLKDFPDHVRVFGMCIRIRRGRHGSGEWTWRRKAM